MTVVSTGVEKAWMMRASIHSVLNKARAPEVSSSSSGPVGGQTDRQHGFCWWCRQKLPGSTGLCVGILKVKPQETGERVRASVGQWRSERRKELHPRRIESTWGLQRKTLWRGPKGLATFPSRDETSHCEQVTPATSWCHRCCFEVEFLQCLQPVS